MRVETLKYVICLVAILSVSKAYATTFALALYSYVRPEVFIGYKKKAGQRSRVMAYGAVISYTLNKVLEPLIDSSPSAQTVSNIADELDKDVRKFHKRRIEDKYKYLFLME